MRFPTRRSRTAPRLLLGLLALVPIGSALADDPPPRSPDGLFSRGNLIAWCIVPFDSRNRGPEDRAAMLERLGFKHFAYDWREEHVPTFDAEVEALKKRGIGLDAFWMGDQVGMTERTKSILSLIERHKIHPELWVMLDLGPDKAPAKEEQEKRVKLAAERLSTFAKEAAKLGCKVGLYNHGGWYGEPENQVAIIERLKGQGINNVGLVYNLHHGHDHVDRLPALLTLMKPYLLAVDLNGTDRDGEKLGRKILPLGQGELDLSLLKVIQQSGYKGRIGIIGHTQDDAEERLRDNLDGLDWLLPQLEGKPPGPKPTPRTPVPPRPANAGANTQAGGRDAEQLPFEGAVVRNLVAEAREKGDARRGAELFASPRLACQSCHKVGEAGGEVGPPLTTVGSCVKPEEIAESILFPRRKIKEGFEAVRLLLADGRSHQGYKVEDTPDALVIKDPATGEKKTIARAEVEDMRVDGTLMPEGLASAMSPGEMADLVRFLSELGTANDPSGLIPRSHAPASFPFELGPIRPERWPNRLARVNRDRIYDFYAKEADFFSRVSPCPPLLPPYPGLDGGTHGHWGNQSEKTWEDGRWNDSELGTVLSGTFRGGAVTVAKGVCVRLGDRGQASTCFNPETLEYEALWSGGFLKFDAMRHGFLGGLKPAGPMLPAPARRSRSEPFTYHGFYRSGNRVIFAYRLGDREMLDSPWIGDDGEFVRVVGPRETHPLADRISGGPSNWPQVIETRGELGTTRPYAVDTIGLPTSNPWKALLFFGDHDFRADGTAFLSTMEGDVWRVEGLDDRLERVRWRRVASGLYHPLGLLVIDGLVHVLGRDQITRLHDLNGDGEADFYECVNNRYATSVGGHDFITGLQRDAQGRFYTASSNQGVIRLLDDTKPRADASPSVEVLATGFRNPDGIGLSPDGVVTVPSSEGDWVPASMVGEVRKGGHYGFGGPRNGEPPDLPLIYLPRGLDNQSAGQVTVPDDRWGPLRGQMVHISHGTGTYFLLLRDKVDGQPQGAVVPMGGDFQSGAHRGRFNPKDGQLYVSGLAGWGTYTPDDGCFQRVRYTGDPVQLPVAWKAHENGVWIRFSRPVDPSIAGQAASQFAQAWNYRYSRSYGSPELSPSHPGMGGHDPVPIRTAHVLGKGYAVFLEMPGIQPVNQLHLHLNVDSNEPIDLYATVHKLAPPYTGIPGYQPTPRTIAAHPILADMSALKNPPVPNPHAKRIPDARSIRIETGPNLSFATKRFTVKAGEAIRLTLANPDVVPHNWALIRPGTLPAVGDLANRLIAEPDAAARQYIPRTDDILAYTDVVEPQGQFTIHFRAPDRPGRYPYLCTFPGHWMVMNGEMIVEAP
ncbi:MAG: plastocyanin/azurin family copper-binding protein [Isosphaeraceae bacterium]